METDNNIYFVKVSGEWKGPYTFDQAIEHASMLNGIIAGSAEIFSLTVSPAR